MNPSETLRRWAFRIPGVNVTHLPSTSTRPPWATAVSQFRVSAVLTDLRFWTRVCKQASNLNKTGSCVEALAVELEAGRADALAVAPPVELDAAGVGAPGVEALACRCPLRVPRRSADRTRPQACGGHPCPAAPTHAVVTVTVDERLPVLHADLAAAAHLWGSRRCRPALFDAWSLLRQTSQDTVSMLKNSEYRTDIGAVRCSLQIAQQILEELPVLSAARRRVLPRHLHLVSKPPRLLPKLHHLPSRDPVLGVSARQIGAQIPDNRPGASITRLDVGAPGTPGPGRRRSTASAPGRRRSTASALRRRRRRWRSVDGLRRRRRLRPPVWLGGLRRRQRTELAPAPDLN